MLSTRPQNARYVFMALQVVLLITLFTFTALKIDDLLSFLSCGIMSLFTLVYLVPIVIMCMCGRASRYETGWVEITYQTLQTAFTAAILLWFGALNYPDLCAETLGEQDEELIPLADFEPGESVENVHDRCKRIPVGIALASLHLVILVLWFGWTLWVATKAASLLGGDWTKSRILRRMSTSQVCKAFQPGRSEEYGMHKQGHEV